MYGLRFGRGRKRGRNRGGTQCTSSDGWEEWVCILLTVRDGNSNSKTDVPPVILARDFVAKMR